MRHSRAIRLLRAFGLFPVALAALSSCAGNDRSLSNVAPEYEQLYQADRPDCVQGLIELDRAVVSHQQCVADSDCEVIYSGGCPLDCFVAINPSSVADVQAAFKVFAAQCPAGFCDCNASGSSRGVCGTNNRCVVQLAQ